MILHNTCIYNMYQYVSITHNWNNHHLRIEKNNSWFVVSIPKNLTHWTPQLPISEQRHGNKNNMVDITDQILICFWGLQSCGYKLHNMYATIP